MATPAANGLFLFGHLRFVVYSAFPCMYVWPDACGALKNVLRASSPIAPKGQTMTDIIKCSWKNVLSAQTRGHSSFWQDQLVPTTLSLGAGLHGVGLLAKTTVLTHTCPRKPKLYYA